MNSQQVQQLINSVSKATPTIWAAAQQQVRGLIVTGIVGGVMAAIVLVVLLLVLRFCIAQRCVITARNVGVDRHKREDTEGWSVGAISSGVGVGFAAIMLAVIIITTLQLIIAPDYAAIQQLTSLAP